MSTEKPSTHTPVMDGATDDLSDSGTPNAEASDLMAAGRDDEIDPPDTAEQG